MFYYWFIFLTMYSGKKYKINNKTPDTKLCFV